LPSDCQTAIRGAFVAPTKAEAITGCLHWKADRMSVDLETVHRVARLARIAVSDAEAETMQGELNTILDWIEQLNEVDVDGVEPMTSVVDIDMKKRADTINDGACSGQIVANAPVTEENFFLVPKVVE